MNENGIAIISKSKFGCEQPETNKILKVEDVASVYGSLNTAFFCSHSIWQLSFATNFTTESKIKIMLRLNFRNNVLGTQPMTLIS